MNNIVSAFVTKSEGLSRRLYNEAFVLYNGQNLKVLALWDTGATNTCISEKVVESLGLIPTGNKDIQTPSGQDVVNTYLVDVVLPNNVLIKDIEVCDSKIGEQKINNNSIGMLIGMDIINLGDLTVSNFNNKTTFTFRTPSVKETDYVKECNLQNIIGPRHGQGLRKKKKR